MQAIRMVAIPTAVADAVRASKRAPVYGHPAYCEKVMEAVPCRHCLRLIAVGTDHAILFTYDRFAGVELLPLPGPVFIHARPCERYPENSVFPNELRTSPRTLEGFSRGRHLLAQEQVTDGRMEDVIERIFACSAVDYINVSSTTAGCYTFRIERQNCPMTRNCEEH